MPRIARLILKDEPAVYHVISRTALKGFVLIDQDKDYFLSLIRHLSKVYFTEVLGFCVMGNHFHLLVKMFLPDEFSNEDLQKRYKLYYGDKNKTPMPKGQIPYFRNKWGNLSEYMREIKQGFSRYYNRTHNRKGYFWSERFKSVIVDNGETLINCLAYIDLNPVRAGITDKPEEYRWNSLGYHVQTRNKEGFLSLDIGLKEFGVKDEQERLEYYRKYVYAKGGLIKGKGKQELDLSALDRFRYRTRYFTDSGIIGSKEFVNRIYRQFKSYFSSAHNKTPKTIRGLEGVYSLKRLSENIV
jgi:REP element-mobilizing transposase RayT